MHSFVDKKSSRKSLTSWLSASFLFGAFYILTFSNIKGAGQIFQIISLILLGCSAISTIIASRIKLYFPTPVEISLVLVGLLSAAVGVTSGSEYSGYFTLTFLATIAAVAIVARGLDFKTIVDTFSYAQILTCITVSAVYWRALPVLLNPLSPNRWSLRFMPFDMHPNLVGFMYGVGAIVLSVTALRKTGILRATSAACAVVSILFVLTASARASLLALFASTALVAFLAWPRMPRSARIASLVATAGALLVSTALWSRLYSYLSIMLEFDSRTRGFSSGGTGRFSIWARGLNHIVESGFASLVGSGLRTSYDVIGFSSESSYLNLIIESGFLAGLPLLISIFFGFGRLVRSVDGERTLAVKITAVWIVSFALVQSIFNRYLIAIGNSTSLLLLFAFTASWLPTFVENRFQRKSEPRKINRMLGGAQ